MPIMKDVGKGKQIMAIKFCAFSDGKRTYAKLGDMCIGSGIQKLEYVHDAANSLYPAIRLDIDLNTFELDDPEKFDKAFKWAQGLPDEKDPAYMVRYNELLKECK